MHFDFYFSASEKHLFFFTYHVNQPQETGNVDAPPSGRQKAALEFVNKEPDEEMHTNLEYGSQISNIDTCRQYEMKNLIASSH